MEIFIALHSNYEIRNHNKGPKPKRVAEENMQFAIFQPTITQLCDMELHLDWLKDDKNFGQILF